MQSLSFLCMIALLSTMFRYRSVLDAAGLEMAYLFEPRKLCGDMVKVQVDFEKLSQQFRNEKTVDRSMEVLQFTLKQYGSPNSETTLFERQTVEDPLPPSRQPANAQNSFTLCLQPTETFRLTLHSYIPASSAEQARHHANSVSVGGALICQKYHVHLDQPFELTPSILAACTVNPTTESTHSIDNTEKKEHFETMNRRTLSTVPSAALLAAGDPTADPSAAPSPSPSSIHPTPAPTRRPTKPRPTAPPTEVPTSIPTSIPTSYPSAHPTPPPTSIPTSIPTSYPSPEPTSLPTATPTHGCDPSMQPVGQPTSQPSSQPSSPSSQPTSAPSSPTQVPTPLPTSPSAAPSLQPSAAPSTSLPSAHPSTHWPTAVPSAPSAVPTGGPTSPSAEPSAGPTAPTLSPSTTPSAVPSVVSTVFPTEEPTTQPTVGLTASPTNVSAPSFRPTVFTTLTSQPTRDRGSGTPQDTSGSRTAFVETDTGIGTIAAGGVVVLAVLALVVFYCVRCSRNTVKVPHAPPNLAMQI